MNNHINKHRTNYNYLCEICGVIFCSFNGLKEHRNVTHFRERYFCDICDKDFKYPGDVSKHKIAVHVEFWDLLKVRKILQYGANSLLS